MLGMEDIEEVDRLLEETEFGITPTDIEEIVGIDRRKAGKIAKKLGKEVSNGRYKK